MSRSLVHVDDVTGADLPVTPERIEAAARAALDTGRAGDDAGAAPDTGRVDERVDRDGPEGSAEVSVTLLPPDQMRALNREYHGVDASTDVLSFRLDTRSGAWTPTALVGDVYVCPAEAEASAAEHGVGAEEEILRLVIHGVLHLLGHDHPEGDERYDSEMFRLQEAVLASLIDAEAAGAHPGAR